MSAEQPSDSRCRRPVRAQLLLEVVTKALDTPGLQRQLPLKHLRTDKRGRGLCGVRARAWFGDGLSELGRCQSRKSWSVSPVVMFTLGKG